MSICVYKNWWPMYVCQMYDTFDGFLERQIVVDEIFMSFRRWWKFWKLSKRTHLWSGRCRDHVSLGEDWMGPVIVPLGCLLYSCIHSCVSRFKRIYATFRGDEWINKRIINRNLISYIKIVYVCYLNSVKSA